MGGWDKGNASWRRISQSEIRNSAAEKRGRAKIPSPPTPFLFARPSDWISEFKIGIFVKKSSDFNQKAPIKNFTLTCAEFFIGPGRIRTVRSERSERRQKR